MYFFYTICKLDFYFLYLIQLLCTGRTVTDKPNDDNDTDNDTGTDSENGDDETSEQIEGVQTTQSNNGVPPTISNNGVPTTISNNGVPPTSAYLYGKPAVKSKKVVPSGRMFKLYK